MELFEQDDGPGDETAGNAPEFTVSELSGAVRRTIEGAFGRVRVRGEIGRVSMPRSGHVYFALKDDRATLDAVAWKGQVARLSVRPEEGLEVIATGRMTTYPGQSKYQLIVDDLAPAGAGALMAMLEKRRAALAAEGLFDAARKKPIPYLPEVIGVVTSPSGAVIRDILHRLRDRFPRRVLIWPVAVQGQACAPEVAAAIRGFNALAPGGPVPRPDLIIVARGGGSLEDLWGFNEEIVVRAAAESAIPLISAVGHETDTTLIDHAADRRAPTPTAAAEMAVPVRLDLLGRTGELGGRLARAMAQRAEARRVRLADLSRGLGRPEALTGPARQRADLVAQRLEPALLSAVHRKRAVFAGLAGQARPELLARFIAAERRALAQRGDRLAPALARGAALARTGLDRLAARLAPATGRMARRAAADRAQLDALAGRLTVAPADRLAALADRLSALDRMRQTLGYAETLRRGYAVIRADGAVATSRTAAAGAAALEIEFHDGRLDAVPGGRGTRPAGRGKPGPGGQGELF
ncbi:MAG: exodeoxyribonuclease VII large subunit [Rhodobacteraceae bacterium]|nr:exodeoxyribonuclease VII large subunit [Paracoccaceae bacterium]